jgi:hypothetical protein
MKTGWFAGIIFEKLVCCRQTRKRNKIIAIKTMIMTRSEIWIILPVIASAAKQSAFNIFNVWPVNNCLTDLKDI